MTSTEIKKMNCYKEFSTPAGIDAVKYYIQLGQFPPALNARQRLRYSRKFPPNDWIVDNNNLYYRPTRGILGGIPPANGIPFVPPPANPNQRINLLVILPANIQAELLRIFQDPKQGLGLGINQFYSQVCSQFIGIKRTVTTDFLKSQGNYQVTQLYKKVVNRPIVCQSPNERWCIDCLHLPKYNIPPANAGNYQYILTVVDHYSKKVWAEAITHPLNSIKTRNAFQAIINRSNTTPHILHSDNGPEFKDQFNTFMLNHNPLIKWVKSAPYSPSSNGMAERMNKELRKKIKIGIATNNTFEWRNHLQDYCDNINAQKSSRTKFKPNELWKEGYTAPVNHVVRPQAIDDHSTPLQIQRNIQARTVASAKKMIEKGVEELSVGDIVRIKVSVLDKLMRKRNKNDLEAKNNIIQYTIANYRVMKVITPHLNNHFYVSRPSYWLNGYDLNNQPTVRILANTEPKEFFASDLMKIPVGSTQPSVGNWVRSRVINRIRN